MKRKGFAIIAAVFLLIVLSALGLFAVSLLSTDTDIALESLSADEAFYIAEAGIPYYIRSQLKYDFDWSDNTAEVTKSFAGGSFTVTPLSSTSNSITLQSSGSITVSGSQVKRVIKYTLQAPDPAGYESFFYALYGGGGPIGGRGDLNTFFTRGNINGDIYLKDDMEKILSGNLNLNGGILEHRSSADIPEVDWAYWQSIADHSYSGDTSFNGTTLTGIYYIDGDAYLDEVTINGTIIATDDIICGGNGNFVVNPDGGRPGFIAADDLYINPSSDASFTINGPIYAGDDIQLENGKNLTINGALAYGDHCYINNVRPININLSEYPITMGFIGTKKRKISSGGFDEI